MEMNSKKLSRAERTKDLSVAIAQAVAERGGRVYYVGGFVRDALLGAESKDVDIEVHGMLPDDLCELLAQFGEVKAIGASFGVYNVSGYDLDIALPRTERPNGQGGHKGFEIGVDPFLGIEQAQRRRDFTINALYMDVLTGEVLDCFGGREDLQAGVLRCVDESTFADDPLRVLRAAQFAARFNMRIDADTIAICSKIDLSSLASERIAEEVKKALMKSSTPSVFFRALREMGQLDEWFPQVEALIGVEQNPLFHAEGDVFEHTMMVLDVAASLRDDAFHPYDFMVAALCHDFGKPMSTFKREDGRTVSYGHETAGIEVARTFVRRVFGERDLAHYVCNMVELHMRPGSLMKQNAGNKAYFRLFDKSVCPHDLVLLTCADSGGRIGEGAVAFDRAALDQKVEQFDELMENPQVTGGDLIAQGVEPGPLLGEVKAFAHKLHLSGVGHDEALTQSLGYWRSLQSQANCNTTGEADVN